MMVNATDERAAKVSPSTFKVEEDAIDNFIKRTPLGKRVWKY